MKVHRGLTGDRRITECSTGVRVPEGKRDSHGAGVQFWGKKGEV